MDSGELAQEIRFAMQADLLANRLHAGCSAALLIAGYESIASAWSGTGCGHAGKPQGLQTPGDSLGVRCDHFAFLTLTLLYPEPRARGGVWVSG